MSDRNINPSGDMYTSFMKIIRAVTIKYFSKAHKYETKDSKMNADGYLDAVNKLDTFFTYMDYSMLEFKTVGITDQRIIEEVYKGNLDAVPRRFREPLLNLRRQREIDVFEETNNYYRMLNGLPDLEDTEYFYISNILAMEYNINPSIPIHKIQDYYNKEESGKGDYLITVIESSGFIDELVEAHPDKKYLQYIGSNRIDLYSARSAKNFQIIQIKKSDVPQSILDIFVHLYEQCREYYVKTIYMSNYSKFIDKYDNFIAMCIMIMTIQQIAVRQISLGIKRDFFDIYAVRTLYEAYDVPFNLNIDEDTQADIVQNLNMLIQNKSTDKVLYNITNLLGFTNVNIYKYYLTKEHKVDIYDVPIFKYTERFNTDTGEIEVVPDYKAMYDLYFQKSELNSEDYIHSFTDKSKRVEYNDVISNDAFWIEDQHVYERLWETEYNFVESKYLSLGVSYSMTEIMFENVFFLKLILQKNEEFKNLSLKLPRILDNTDVPIFDIIVLLLCLTATKHNLIGEVITVPTQVIAVNDYIHNTERGGHHHDTFKFNYDYFFHPDEFEDIEKMNDMQHDLIDYMNKLNNVDDLAESEGFNFDYFSIKNKDREKNINFIKSILGEEDHEKFLYYVEKVSIVKSGDNIDKIRALNEMFSSIKGLYKLISFYLTKTSNLETYDSLKTIYRSLFISKEMKDIFTISNKIYNEQTGEIETFERTAWTYFEFLYHLNPKLYKAIFEFNLENEYKNYLTENKLDESDLSVIEFTNKVAKGEIYLNYGRLIHDVSDSSVRDEKLYSYVNHIISRIEMVVNDIQFMYFMNDTSTPLETLLLQLVRFFKSYTVDILGLDTLYVCDFKPENTLRLFDKISYIKKLIGIDENLKLSYSDVISNLITKIEKNEKCMLTDKKMYYAFLLIDELYGNRNSIRIKDIIHQLQKIIQLNDTSLCKIIQGDKINLTIIIENNSKLNIYDKMLLEVFLLIDELYGNRNSIRLNEILVSLNKICELQDDSLQKITDNIHVNSSITTNNNIELRDKVYKLWFE